MMFLNRSIIFSAIGFTKVFGAADTPITENADPIEGSISEFANFDDATPEKGADVSEKTAKRCHGTTSAMSRIASVTSLDGVRRPKPSYASQSGMTLSGGCSKRNHQNKVWCVGSIVKINSPPFRVGIIKTLDAHSGFMEVTPIEAQQDESYCQERFRDLLDDVAKEHSLKTIMDFCSIDNSHNDIKRIIEAVAGDSFNRFVQGNTESTYYKLAKVICDAYTNREKLLDSCPTSNMSLSHFIEDIIEPLFLCKKPNKRIFNKLSQLEKGDRQKLINKFNIHLDDDDKIRPAAEGCCVIL